jgi:hypothetical protein
MVSNPLPTRTRHYSKAVPRENKQAALAAIDIFPKLPQSWRNPANEAFSRNLLSERGIGGYDLGEEATEG